MMIRKSDQEILKQYEWGYAAVRKIELAELLNRSQEDQWRRIEGVFSLERDAGVDSVRDEGSVAQNRGSFFSCRPFSSRERTIA